MKMGDSALEALTARALSQHNLVRPGERVLAAVSGGADSVALLLVLDALKASMGFSLVCAHYDHGIRGEASREDARFVRGLCRSLGVECIEGRGDVPSLARAWRASLEDAARRARYAFLEEAAARCGADKIALAHQREDQAETLLLHLAHGCGPEGLAAMRPLSGNRIRPLLGVSRAALEAYVSARGFSWRQDATNADLHHARNFLRHEVFPLLRRLNPRVEEAMANAAALCAQAVDEQALAAERALAGRVRRMPYGAFWRLPDGDVTAAQARAFARWAGVPPLNRPQSEALAAARSANLPGGWRSLRTPARLHLLCGAGAAYTYRPEDFTAEPCAPDTPCDGVRVQVLDADRLSGAVFRARRDGDRFAPLGMEGEQKLKRTLQDAKVDLPFRDLLPVLARDGRVLWIVGLKASREAAVTADTRRAVQIRFRSALPWDMEETEHENQK